MALKWTRGKVPANLGTGTHTTHTTTLCNGTEIMVKSVEGSFFFYKNGVSTGGFVDSLKDAKVRIQRVEDAAAKMFSAETGIRKVSE